MTSPTREPTLAERLRALKAATAAWNASKDMLVGTPAALWDDCERNRYLHGHDDATSEAQEKLDALTARVRELEAQLAAPPSPAAVGVVDSFLYYEVRDSYNSTLTSTMDYNEAEAFAVNNAAHGPHIVALVEPDRIVPLASKEPVRWETDPFGYPYNSLEIAERACGPESIVTPLYKGQPQPVRKET